MNILPTGAGVVLQKENFLNLCPEEINWVLMNKGFLLVRDLSYSKDDMEKMARSLGTLIEYTGEKAKIGWGYKNIQEIGGDIGKVNTGKGELPLHSDGGLLGTRVDLIMLYASKVKNSKYQGSTNICDHVNAIAEMPLYLRQILEEETFEVKVLDQEYYGGQIPKDWYKIPVFIDQGWVRKLMILFPFEKEEKIKGWEVRMKGFTEKASENFFKDLKAYMTQHRYYYKHCWKEKDFLIFDNRKVLHSRSPFDQDSIRILYRAQVDVSKNPFNEILEKIACSGTQ